MSRYRFLYFDSRGELAGRENRANAIDPDQRRHRSLKAPLSLHDTVARGSTYAFVIAALWGAVYLLFVFSGVHRP